MTNKGRESETSSLKDIASSADDEETKRSKELDKIRSDLIAQEHRFFPVIINFIKFGFGKCSDKKKAAWTAIVFFMIPRVVIATATIVGIITVLLMHKNNELIAYQTYVQANSDRRAQIATIVDKLYRSTSENRTPANVSDGGHYQSARPEPYFNVRTRTVALEQYVEILKEPLIKPDFFPNETLLSLGRRWLKKNLSCTDESENVRSQKPDNEIPTLNVADAFLNGVVWPNTSGIIVYAKSADLRNADLKNAVLPNANFEYADMRGIDLSNSDIKKSNFRGADLRNSNLSEALIDHAVMTNVAMDLSRISGASLKSTLLFDSSLIGIEADGADFSNAKLQFSKLTGSKLNNSIFTSAFMHQSHLDEADLTNSNMSEANLADAKFQKSILRNAIFEHSNLRFSDMRGANLSGADMAGSRLGDSTVTCEQLKNVNGIWLEKSC